MKRLYLLRHATALPADGHGDKARKLSPAGLIEAGALGRTLMRKHYTPSYILCSPALRTRQTLDQLGLNEIPHEYPDRLYNAGAHEILHHIHELDDAHTSALVIAHNPGIYELSGALCVRGDPVLLDRMMGGFHPCTMAIVACGVLNWRDVRAGQNELADFLEASDYNA